MNLTVRHLVALAAILFLISLAGCSGRDVTDLPVARAKIDPLVFDDDYGDDVYFQPFFQTHYTAMELDSVYAYEGFAPDGSRSLKVNIPAAGSALGGYSGGVLTSGAPRDLADFNALVFYARSDRDVTLNVAGFGNDNTGASLYEAQRDNSESHRFKSPIHLTGNWTRYVIPIPAPSRLIAERGLFTFAEGVEEAYPEGYNIWFDEMMYANLGGLTFSLALMENWTRQFFIGSTVIMGEGRTDFQLDGENIIVYHSPNYFDFLSSDPAVATVGRSRITIVGAGEATISATLEGSEVFGLINLTGLLPPTVAAEPPTLPAGNVISLFSDVYKDVPVDSWRADWPDVTTQVEDFVVAGDNTKMYHSLNWVGIQFRNPEVDASAMTHFHLDVYAPSGSDFKVKLVSFPPESEWLQTFDLILNTGSDPAFNSGSWCSLDIPLENFVIPEGWDWAHIGELVLSTTNSQLVLVDNIYWHN